jgi:N-acetylglucosamine malate deacetylase 1
LRIASALTLGYADTPGGKLRLRLVANRAVRALLLARSRRLPHAALGSVLVFAPHPDDETLGCGGTVALLVRDGAAVDIAFLTDGAASHPNHPLHAPSDIAARRRTEAQAATGALGVDQRRIVLGNVPDGTLARLDESQRSSVLDSLGGIVARVSPRAILLPCRSDGSSDHDAAFILVSRAVAQSGLRPRILEFPIWSLWNPTLLLRPLLTCRRVWRVAIGDVLGVKAKAIASYPSQTQPIPPDSSAVLPAAFVPMFLNRYEFLFEH